MGEHYPVALVSGANRGIGLETARRLVDLGAFVYVGARDLNAGKRAAELIADAGGCAQAIQLDIADWRSVAGAVTAIEVAGRGLDILLNNAGRTIAASPTRIDPTNMAEVFATNVFGTVELTTALLPLLARSRAARIVNVSSTTASLSMTSAGHDFGGDGAARVIYSSSKAALNMITIHLAAALRDDPTLSKVKINAVTPGNVATDMNNHTGVRKVCEGAEVILWAALLGPDGPSGGFFNDKGPVAW